MGQAACRVLPDQSVPPLVVRCIQPSTLGEMVPPPTHPNWSSWKNVGPSKTSSTEWRQFQDAVTDWELRRYFEVI